MNKISYLSATLATLLSPAFLASADTFQVESLTFETSSETTCTLTAIAEDCPETLVIPASVSNAGAEYSVTAIGQGAAMNRETIIDVTIPGTVTKIETNAFYGAWKMTTLSIGEGITSIANNAFGGCTALTSITIKATTPPMAGNSSFSSTTLNKATLYVPEDAVATYKGDFWFWGDFTTILPIGETPEEPEPVDPPADENVLKLIAMSPASNSQLHSLSNFTLSFELTKEETDAAYMIGPVSGKASEITLQKGDGDPIHALTVKTVESTPMQSVIIRFPYIPEEGEYTLTVPAGCIAKWRWNAQAQKDEIFDDTYNAEIKATYTVSASVETIFSKYTLSPASGKTLGSIYEIEMAFPKAPYGMNKNEDLPINLTNGTELYTGMLNGWGNENIRINFRTESETYITISEPGEYTLTIPAGVFSANGEANEEIVATYTISEDVEFEYTCTPLNLSQESLPTGGQTTVAFTFPDAAAIDFPFLSEEPITGFTVKYGDEELMRVSNAMGQRGYQTRVYTGDNTLTLVINPGVFSQPGILTVVAEKGAFKVDGHDSPAIDYAVNYGVDKRYAFTVSPVTGTKSNDLSRFTVSFPDAETAEYRPEEAFIVLFMLRNPYTEYTVAPVEGADCPTFDIVFDPAPSVLGDYDFTIDTRSFLLDKYYFNPIITGKYTLWDNNYTETPEDPTTGVVEIESERIKAAVYSLDGRLILPDATREDASNLEPGLYIRNGKKIIVK